MFTSWNNTSSLAANALSLLKNTFSSGDLIFHIFFSSLLYISPYKFIISSLRRRWFSPAMLPSKKIPN